MPPWAAPRISRPVPGWMASAPMRPAIAVKIGVLRVTWTIGSGPRPVQVPVNVAGPGLGVPFLRRSAAARAAAARNAPACWLSSGWSPAVRRLMKKRSRCSWTCSSSSLIRGGAAPGCNVGVSSTTALPTALPGAVTSPAISTADPIPATASRTRPMLIPHSPWSPESAGASASRPLPLLRCQDLTPGGQLWPPPRSPHRGAGGRTEGAG